MNYKDSPEHQQTQQKADAWRNAGMEFGSTSIGCGCSIITGIIGFVGLIILIYILDAIFNFL